MAITIKKVSTKRELKKFIRFNYRMYKGNPYSVPDLYDDMLNTFNKKKNAAFEFCEADYFPGIPGRQNRRSWPLSSITAPTKVGMQERPFRMDRFH